MRDFCLITGIVLLSACSPIALHTEQEGDTTPPQIRLNGLPIDTAFLHTRYHDKSVSLLDEINGELRCVDEGTQLKTEGYVDTRIAGTYTLSYTGHDNAGNISPTLTRTVHVVQNSIAFLTGDYNVTYTCTAFTRGVESSTVSTGTYKATLIPGQQNGYFELISVNTGALFKAVDRGYLEGNKMMVDYWDSDFAKTEASGYISADKNSFTIEATTFMYTYLYYKCTNVYTKQVVIK
jgi:hypothetical protein